MMSKYIVQIVSEHRKKYPCATKIDIMNQPGNLLPIGLKYFTSRFFMYWKEIFFCSAYWHIQEVYMFLTSEFQSYSLNLGIGQMLLIEMVFIDLIPCYLLMLKIFSSLWRLDRICQPFNMIFRSWSIDKKYL